MPSLLRNLLALLAGILVGLVFLKLGPLFVLGLVFLAGYSIIFLATAAVAASFRVRPPQPGQENLP